MEPGWNDKHMLKYNIAIFIDISVTYLQDLNSKALINYTPPSIVNRTYVKT